MAAVAGKKGLVSYKGVPVYRINNWSLDVNVEALDTTSWSTGTDQWKTNISGLSEWSGSISGFWDVSTSSTAQKDLQTNVLTPATGTITLEGEKDAGGKYSGDVVLTTNSISFAIDAVGETSFDFVGNGTLTYSTTT